MWTRTERDQSAPLALSAKWISYCVAVARLPGYLFRGERGVQCASDEYTEVLGAAKVVASMTRKGNCRDNAVSESFFSTLKFEIDALLDGSESKAQVTGAVRDSICFYTNESGGFTNQPSTKSGEAQPVFGRERGHLAHARRDDDLDGPNDARGGRRCGEMRFAASVAYHD